MGNEIDIIGTFAYLAHRIDSDKSLRIEQITINPVDCAVLEKEWGPVLGNERSAIYGTGIHVLSALNVPRGYVVAKATRWADPTNAIATIDRLLRAAQ